jgi:hypothetical protein
MYGVHWVLSLNRAKYVQGFEGQDWPKLFENLPKSSEVYEHLRESYGIYSCHRCKTATQVFGAVPTVSYEAMRNTNSPQ